MLHAGRTLQLDRSEYRTVLLQRPMSLLVLLCSSPHYSCEQQRWAEASLDARGAPHVQSCAHQHLCHWPSGGAWVMICSLAAYLLLDPKAGAVAPVKEVFFGKAIPQTEL